MFSSEIDYPVSVKWLFAAMILASAGFSAFHCTQAVIDPDELQHLHAAWLWDQGIQPYTGFFEHHPATFWLLLRPIVHAHSYDLLPVVREARLLSWAMASGLLAAGWWLFAILLGRKAAWNGTAFMALYMALSECLTQVRPDTASLLATVLGTALLLEGLGWGLSGEASPWRCLLAGVLLALGVLLHTKAMFWVLILAATLATCAVLELRRGRRSSLKAGVWAVLGGLIPLAAAGAWVILCNNPAAVWRCNFTLNGHFLGILLKHPFPFSESWQLLLSCPALSLPMAILGMAGLLGGSAPWQRKLLTVMLTAAAVLLVLLAAGPFAQYHLHLQLMLAGLGGLGAAMALAVLPERVQQRAVAAFLVAFVLVQAVLVAARNLQSPSALQTPLEPLQKVLDEAAPEGRYVGILQWNPVWMMDAEPQMNARLVCTDTPETMADLRETIETKRPRFVIGMGADYWSSKGVLTRMPPWQSLQKNYQPMDTGSLFVLVRRSGVDHLYVPHP